MRKPFAFPMGWRQLLKWHLNLNIGPILFLCPKPKQASKVQKIVWNSLTNKVKNRNTKPPDKEKRKEKARHNITRGNKTEVIRSTPSIKEVSIIIISSSHQSPSQPFSVFALTLCPHTHTHSLFTARWWRQPRSHHWGCGGADFEALLFCFIVNYFMGIFKIL